MENKPTSSMVLQLLPHTEGKSEVLNLTDTVHLRITHSEFELYKLEMLNGKTGEVVAEIDHLFHFQVYRHISKVAEMVEQRLKELSLQDGE